MSCSRPRPSRSREESLLWSAITFVTATLLVSCTGSEPPDIEPMPVVPSQAQLEYRRMEFIGFVHFTVNTYTDREWGYGDEDPDIFRPDSLDTDQWARIAAEVGMGELILTAKHHDGFALWPSDFTEHSVASSAWRNGGGDVVAEFVASAREHDVEAGLYLSPWDRNHPEYGTPAYLDYYRAQLRELLTEYGPVTELWVDGANGGDGYYGGAREERRIDRESYYEWPETFALAKSLQPDLLIFSDAGPDIRWIGNENGYAGQTNWSTIDTDGIVIGAADSDYLNTGDPDGADWVVPLCNTSIRPGWFYHADQDDRVKSPQELLEVYYRSVGRNCVLLLNLPPDPSGRFHQNDIAVLREFRRILDSTFDENLAAFRPVQAARARGGHPKFLGANVVDGDLGSYWAAAEGATTGELRIDLQGSRSFDRVVLQEPIHLGQRISEFEVDARVEGEWRTIARATTVGYRRILRLEPVTTDAVRIRILDALATPALNEIGLYASDPGDHPPEPPS